MVIKTINGAMLRKMILNGAKLLDNNKQHVDSLNVFPVPDGDTGTNMSLTLLSAAKEVSACPNNNIDLLCEAVSKGALRGARGNSGVITSQILKGMASVLAECEEEITVKDLAAGMELPGIVTNITAFGAFVDIGIKQNGLIHISKMGVKGISDPSKILKLHQQVTVRVLDIDTDRQRISLQLIKQDAGRRTS